MQAAQQIGLDRLPVGGRARVEGVDLDPPDAQRLMEMGLVPGTVVHVLRRAPLGDPLELIVRRSRLTLRRAVAARVRVSRLAEDAS